MILFSVITPHYNSTSLLKRLLSTIPTDDSIQLIVVDDKSVEDITEVKDLVIARGGLFLRNTTEKKGAGICRNLGLAQAVGKWIVFADADDYFLNGSFDIMRQHSDSEADIIHFVPTSIDLETGEVSTRHIWYEKLVQRYLAEPIEENEMMLRYRHMVPWSKMLRCEMIREAGILFDEVITSEDVMFSARCGYYAKRIEAFDDVIYCVTKSKGSLTMRRDEAACRASATVHRDKYKFLEEHVDLKKYGCVVPMGIRFLSDAARQGYSIKSLYEIYRYFRQENVTLINFAMFRYILRHMIKERRS